MRHVRIIVTAVVDAITKISVFAMISIASLRIVLKVSFINLNGNEITIQIDFECNSITFLFSFRKVSVWIGLGG